MKLEGKPKIQRCSDEKTSLVGFSGPMIFWGVVGGALLLGEIFYRHQDGP